MARHKLKHRKHAEGSAYEESHESSQEAREEGDEKKQVAKKSKFKTFIGKKGKN